MYVTEKQKLQSLNCVMIVMMKKISSQQWTIFQWKTEKRDKSENNIYSSEVKKKVRVREKSEKSIWEST